MTTNTLAITRRPSRVVAIGIVGFAVALALASQIAVPIPGTPVPITLQPLVVVNGRADSQFLPSHLAAQGFYLLRARTQLREIRDILLR